MEVPLKASKQALGAVLCTLIGFLNRAQGLHARSEAMWVYEAQTRQRCPAEGESSLCSTYTLPSSLEHGRGIYSGLHKVAVTQP